MLLQHGVHHCFILLNMDGAGGVDDYFGAGNYRGMP
jgi:hypothetical protein